MREIKRAEYVPLDRGAIASHPHLLDALKLQSASLLEAYRHNPRVSSTFATQQRWLLAHVGLALHFARGKDDVGITTSRFLEMVRRYAVASRNTADSFLKEMLKYDVVRPVLIPGRDRRTRPMEPTGQVVDALRAWMLAHLLTLDRLDGGDRFGRLLAEPDALSRLQPLVAEGLLRSPVIREPVRTFSLFTWLNNGGVIMDWLIAGLNSSGQPPDRFGTPVTSIAEMAGWLRISRSHLTRKLREAESLGSLGWQGVRGSSAMWVSAGFVAEIMEAQAEKLAIIDAAFGAAQVSRVIDEEYR